MKPKSKFEPAYDSFQIVAYPPKGDKPTIAETDIEVRALWTLRALLKRLGDGARGGVYPQLGARRFSVRRFYVNDKGNVHEVDLGTRKVIR